MIYLLRRTRSYDHEDEVRMLSFKIKTKCIWYVAGSKVALNLSKYKTGAGYRERMALPQQAIGSLSLSLSLSLHRAREREREFAAAPADRCTGGPIVDGERK